MNTETSDKFHLKVTLPSVILILLMLAYGLGRYIGEQSGQERGTRIANESFQKDAIKQGFAQYDAITGAWRWKTPDEMPINLPKIEPVANPVQEAGPKVITSLNEPSLFPAELMAELQERLPSPPSIQPAPERIRK